MHGHVYINFCIPMVIQTLLFSTTDRILTLDINSSLEQS